MRSQTVYLASCCLRILWCQVDATIEAMVLTKPLLNLIIVIRSGHSRSGFDLHISHHHRIKISCKHGLFEVVDIKKLFAHEVIIGPSGSTTWWYGVGTASSSCCPVKKG